MESGSLFRGAIPALHLESTCHVALHNVLQHGCLDSARMQINARKKVRRYCRAAGGPSVLIALAQAVAPYSTLQVKTD